MTRLRRSDPAEPGISRRRRGRGFSYSYADGQPVTDPEARRRIQALAVPPAWKDVWICPWPNGHIQAVGVDSAGRRQYRYHDDWRTKRDREKFDRTVAFARALPALRATVEADLARGDLGRQRVLAATVRLLDIGLFRVGGEEYAEDHETFGVASLRKEHVRTRQGVMRFDYAAKGSIRRTIELADADACAVVAALRRRRGGSDNLFAYREGRRWVDVHAHDVNRYIKAAAGEQFSSKDFRTWSGTVLAAAALAADPSASKTGRRRSVGRAVASVADRLGNTPAVCRSAYVDPRVIGHFDAGDTIAVDLPLLAPDRSAGPRLDERQQEERRALEEAVIDLIDD